VIGVWQPENRHDGDQRQLLGDERGEVSLATRQQVVDEPGSDMSNLRDVAVCQGENQHHQDRPESWREPLLEYSDRTVEGWQLCA
jgi:hypothetical protein